jgi:hypothetical protein
MAIVKALQAIETININNNTPRTINVHTAGRITLESLKNTKKSKSSHRRNQKEDYCIGERKLEH